MTPKAPIEQTTPAATRSDFRIAAVFCLTATLLFAFRIQEPRKYIYDEVYYAFTSAELARGNADANVWYTKAKSPIPYVAYAWVHPPISGLFMQAGIRIVGDTPLGWRLPSAIFGGFGIGLLYLIGASMFGRRIGVTAALLMHCDGMWFVHARTCMIDAYVTCFILLGYLLFWGYLTRPSSTNRRYLVATGIAAGLAGATKWTGLLSLGMFGVLALARELREARPWRVADVLRRFETLLVAFVLAPLVVYVASYAQFFAMGHTPRQWIELQRQMLYYHTHLHSAHAWASAWWTWPLDLRPVWFFGERAADGSERHILSLGNPTLWWAFLPAGLACAYHWKKSVRRAGCQSTALAVVLLGFFGQWLPWALSPRLAFQYYILPAMPFGCIAIAYALSRVRSPRITTMLYGGAVLITFLVLYPNFSALSVPQKSARDRFWLGSWDPYAPAKRR